MDFLFISYMFWLSYPIFIGCFGILMVLFIGCFLFFCKMVGHSSIGPTEGVFLWASGLLGGF